MIEAASHEGDTHRASNETTNRPARSVRFPSPQFPGPPTVTLDVPESWLPIGPEGYARFGPKVDLAVIGPHEIRGVRPSVVVSVSRTLPTDDPRGLLTTLANLDRPEGHDRNEMFHDTSRSGEGGATAQHLCHVMTQLEQDGGRAVRRMTCQVYVHGDRMAHVIVVIGSVEGSDHTGFDALAAAFESLAVVQDPGYRTEQPSPAPGTKTSHG